MDAFGTATAAHDGSTTLRYQRHFPRPIATVWSALTQPDRLADWLGQCAVEPVVGGRFDVFLEREAHRQVTGRFLVWDEPRLLSFTWNWPDLPETIVRIELSADTPQSTLMDFVHEGVTSDKQNLVLPGWHVYFERLGEALGGRQPSKDFSERFEAMRTIYASGPTPQAK